MHVQKTASLFHFVNVTYSAKRGFGSLCSWYFKDEPLYKEESVQAGFGVFNIEYVVACKQSNHRICEGGDFKNYLALTDDKELMVIISLATTLENIGSWESSSSHGIFQVVNIL